MQEKLPKVDVIVVIDARLHIGIYPDEPLNARKVVVTDLLTNAKASIGYAVSVGELLNGNNPSAKIHPDYVRVLKKLSELISSTYGFDL